MSHRFIAIFTAFALAALFVLGCQGGEDFLPLPPDAGADGSKGHDAGDAAPEKDAKGAETGAERDAEADAGDADAGDADAGAGPTHSGS